jgi:phosphohistidine swiveling domain-containing protein
VSAGEMTGQLAGAGERVAGDGEFGGRIARADSVEDVLALAQEDLSAVVLLTEQASASAFVPILPLVAGVICTRGGPSAHLAIVSRGLQLPCVMQVQLERELQPGDVVAVDGAGKVWLR